MVSVGKVVTPCRVKSFRKAVSTVMDDLVTDSETIENFNIFVKLERLHECKVYFLRVNRRSCLSGLVLMVMVSRWLQLIKKELDTVLVILSLLKNILIRRCLWFSFKNGKNGFMQNKCTDSFLSLASS